MEDTSISSFTRFIATGYLLKDGVNQFVIKAILLRLKLCVLITAFCQCNDVINMFSHRLGTIHMRFDSPVPEKLSCEAAQQCFALIGRPSKLGNTPTVSDRHCCSTITHSLCNLLPTER